MLQDFSGETPARERILAGHIGPVASDLRLLDLQPLAHHIVSNRTGNLSSVVDSSCELYFKPNALVFLRLAEIELCWSARPRVKLDMKLQLRGVTAAFRLTLDAAFGAVELIYLTFETPVRTPRHGTRLFARRLSEARRTGTVGTPYDRDRGA